MTETVFAVAGDIHGHHHTLIEALEAWNSSHPQQPLAFVLQVGDFEPVRDESDLLTMRGPPDRRQLGDFRRVISGELRYPTEVLFIGGNHEPYGWLEAYPRGGTLIPGITYLGRAGRVERAGLRIAGLSGIFSPTRYAQEVPPTWSHRLSGAKEPTYFRESDVAWLLDSGPADILLTHDWPKGLIGHFGNEQSRLLMETLHPRYHFAGHIHRAVRKKLRYDTRLVTTFIGLNHVGMGPGAIVFMGWDGRRLRELAHSE